MAHHLVILYTLFPQLREIIGNGHSYQLPNDAGVPFMEGENVIFNEEQDSSLVQVKVDIGVIVEIVLDADEMEEL